MPAESDTTQGIEKRSSSQELHDETAFFSMEVFEDPEETIPCTLELRIMTHPNNDRIELTMRHENTVTNQPRTYKWHATHDWWMKYIIDAIAGETVRRHGTSNGEFVLRPADNDQYLMGTGKHHPGSPATIIWCHLTYAQLSHFRDALEAFSARIVHEQQ